MPLDTYFRFSTNNQYDIPLLDITLQADGYMPPMKTWGASKRNTPWSGTVNFYTHDVRFTALKKHPDTFLKTGCNYAIEPNFSTSHELDFIYNLEAIYWKRRLARYWQTYGVRIFVDLTVDGYYDELNLLGVPPTWNAYAIRGFAEHPEWIEQAFTIACQHADSSTPLFLVFGGGQTIATLCRQHPEWLWIENTR